MPMYEINRTERGERRLTYKVVAEDEEQALDLVFDGLEPEMDYFKIYDSDNEVQELPDCECGICRSLGYPWACEEAEPEDYVLDLGEDEKAWE